MFVRSRRFAELLGILLLSAGTLVALSRTEFMALLATQAAIVGLALRTTLFILGAIQARPERQIALYGLEFYCLGLLVVAFGLSERLAVALFVAGIGVLTIQRLSGSLWRRTPNIPAGRLN